VKPDSACYVRVNAGLTLPSHVRLSAKSGVEADMPGGPLRASCGHTSASASALAAYFSSARFFQIAQARAKSLGAFALAAASSAEMYLIGPPRPMAIACRRAFTSV
jgi:hypothetical protein